MLAAPYQVAADAPDVTESMVLGKPEITLDSLELHSPLEDLQERGLSHRSPMGSPGTPSTAKRWANKGLGSSLGRAESIGSVGSVSRLATPEGQGSTARYGERYSASLAAATLSGPTSPATASHRLVVAREGEPTDAKIWGSLHASEGFATPQHALRAATTVVVAMRAGMAAQRTLALLRRHGYVATLAPSCEAALLALAAPPCGLKVLLAEPPPPPHTASHTASHEMSEMCVARLRRAMAARQLEAPLAVLLPHSRRAEGAQLRREGAAACVTRPLVPAEVSALWQLAMQQLVSSRDAECALRQEVRTKQRAFVAQLLNYGWPAV